MTGGALAASAMSAPPLMVEPSLYWLSVSAAVVLGILLATFDDGNSKGGGNNPTSHLQECKDSTDELFAELFADGVGLGLLEPLWRLFTPEGALWTLLTGWSPRDRDGALGLRGLASAVGSVLGALGALLATGFNICVQKPCVGLFRRRKSKDQLATEGGANAAPTQPTHEKVHMDFPTQATAYAAFACLFAAGLIRDYAILFRARILRDKVARKFLARETWTTGWVQWYLVHIYSMYVDIFNRPLTSAPDAFFGVVKRRRKGWWFFAPLHELEHTGEVQKCLNLASYNYLGFGGVDEFCTPAAKETALQQSFSPCGTRVEGGTLPVHRDLETEVASFLGKEDALVFGMGFATNSTVLPALLESKLGGKGILVLSDALNHRSIVEGVRLSGATVRAFSHNCMTSLEAELQRAAAEGQPGGAGPWRKVFIVVEGIYSMEGDFCRLREIVSLKNKYQAYLYLDEAHSIGAVGPTGRGVTDLLGVPRSEVEVMMGTFTKSFGSAGGYVASSSEVINVLRQRAPGNVLSFAMAPPCAAQALAALRVITGHEGGGVGAAKLASIRDNCNFLRHRLTDAGFKVLGDADSPIIPIMTHSPPVCAGFTRACFEQGIAVVGVGYPAVPVMYERIRLCVSAAHTREQLEHASQVLIQIGKAWGNLYDKGLSKEEKTIQGQRVADYSTWLRSAPIVSRGEAVSGVTVLNPEPVMPTFEPVGVAAAALEAAIVPEPRGARDFRLFDPLGYAMRPLSAAQHAIQTSMANYGFGACGPRGFYGTTMPHLDLEAAIARYLGVEASIVYSAGVATASSVLPAIVQPGDHVIVDTKVHLGILTGLRLCKAEISWVPHGDIAAVEAALASKSAGKKKGAKPQQLRTFIIVEAINQRTGQVAPLLDLLALKDKHGALLLLDESVSLGSLGAHGRGLTEVCGVDASRVDGIIGSLEHALAGVGGFCAGRRSLVQHQRLAGAGFCFSAAGPPSSCSATQAILADLGAGGASSRLSDLQENSAALHSVMLRAVDGIDDMVLISSPESYVKHFASTGAAENVEQRLLAVAAQCRTAGVRVQVCSPDLCAAEAAFAARLRAPPSAAPTLRVCASAIQTASDIEALGEALQTAFDAVFRST